MNDARGRFSPLRPALCMRTALATAVRASSCPRTDCRSVSSIWINFSTSPAMSLLTGMPVVRETTLPISSEVTESWIRLTWAPDSCSSPSLGNLASRSGMVEYLNSPAFAKSPCLCERSSSKRARSSSSLVSLMPSISAFSVSQTSVNFLDSSCLFLKSSWSLSLLSRLLMSVSFRSDSSSIWMVVISRSNSRMTSGFDSCCNRRADAASSTKSIALSGKNRSVI